MTSCSALGSRTPTASMRSTRVRHDPVADRHRIGNRFRLTDSDRVCAVQQQAYNKIDDDRISWPHVLCVGSRPVSATASH